MAKLINCFAVATDGTWFTTRANMVAYKNEHPSAQIFKIGDNVTIQREGLLTTGTRGRLTAVDRNSKGTLIAEIKWLEGAPPLRVKLASLERFAPKQFYMVIPYNARYQSQNTGFGSGSRREGIAPAVNRFPTREAAEQYITRERGATGFNDYVILQSIGMSTVHGWLNNPA